MRDAANAVELSIDNGSVKSSTGGGTTTNPDESETENPLGYFFSERKKRVVRMAVLHTEGDTVMADTLEFDEMPIADDASLALNDMEKKHKTESKWNISY
ncbi:hypothetical protein [Bacteroides caecigallinarum]|uniref:hypothetical protein n=1 Tax=Bacteroides caecigallinarum TaxID=1411144 RepID=UPI003B8A98DF